MSTETALTRPTHEQIDAFCAGAFRAGACHVESTDGLIIARRAYCEHTPGEVAGPQAWVYPDDVPADYLYTPPAAALWSRLEDYRRRTAEAYPPVVFTFEGTSARDPFKLPDGSPASSWPYGAISSWRSDWGRNIWQPRFLDPPDDYLSRMTGGLRGPIIGVEVADGPARTVLTEMYVDPDGRQRVLNCETLPGLHARVRLTRKQALYEWRQLWRRVRPRFFDSASIDFEPRDWWALMYGPTRRAGDQFVHLYFGIGLPWVLHLRFTAEGT